MHKTLRKVRDPSFGWYGIDQYQDGRGNIVHDGNQLLNLLAHDVYRGDFQKRMDENMTQKMIEVTDLLDKSMVNFKKSVAAYTSLTDELNAHSKKACGALKDQLNRVGESYAQLQKKVDFRSLEKEVELLERAASAMERLSELEQSGKLKKITESLK